MRALIACLFGLVLFRTSPAIAMAAEANQPDWVRVGEGTAFSFEAPQGMRAAPLQGIDSLVGGYASEHFTVSFDYGPFSNSLQGAAPWEKIDGRPSKFESGASPECQSFPGDELHGVLEARVYVVRQLSPKIALMMDGCARDEGGLEELQRLFRSIRFGPDELFSAPTVTTEVSDYPKLLKDWSPTGLVNQFPRTLPSEAADVSLAAYPGYLQGTGFFQLRLRLPAHEVEAIMAKAKATAVRSCVPRLVAGSKSEERFPSDFVVYALATNGDWNHPTGKGIAISVARSEVVYWAQGSASW